MFANEKHSLFCCEKTSLYTRRGHRDLNILLITVKNERRNIKCK